MPSLLETPSFSNPLILLLYTFAAHGFILFNDGLYWDGWMMDSWQRRKEWNKMKRFCSEVGMPFQAYLHKFIARFPNRTLVYRAIVVSSTYASSLAVYLITTRFGFLDENQGLVLALLYLSYTGYHMNVDTLIVLQYGFPVAIFYWAAYVTLVSLDATGATHWGFHLVSLLMFLLAFSANSLLVYYFGFLGLKLLMQFYPLDHSWLSAYNVVIHNLDYICLPFVFWIFKEKFTPRHGHYKNYNRISLNFRRIAGGFRSAMHSGVLAPIAAPIRSAWQARIMWIPVIASVFVFYFPSHAVIDSPTIPQPLAIILFTFGTLLLGLATLPYILVGQNFAPGGYATKHHLLLHLPVSLMLLGAITLLVPADAVLSVIVFVLLVNFIHLNSVYLYFIAVVAKDRSWLYKLSKIDRAKGNSFFYIEDTHSIQGDKYFPQNSPAYSFYMLDWLWGGGTHIGLMVSQSRSERLNSDQISKLMIETTLAFDMQGVNTHGSQATLEISDGVERSPIRVALKYLRERYLPGGNVQRILERVTDLKYAAL